MALHGRAEHVGEQLRAETDAEHGFALLERALDRDELRFQVGPVNLVLDVHGPAEHDEAAITVDVRLSVWFPLEVVEADPVAARPNQRIERPERLDGYVLKD
jgi:hypothetical protein